MARTRDTTAGAGPRAEKVCDVCGRRIEWRRAWAADWEAVRYCSKACRGRGVTDLDRDLETTTRWMLSKRGASGSICPSEVARYVHGRTGAGGPGEDGWRELMEPARMAARRLVAAGEVQITQRGSVVDPSTAKGPVRVRSAR